MFGEDVGSKADLLLSAKSAFPPSLAVRCCRQAPRDGLRRSSTDTPQALNTAKMLKLGIADFHKAYCFGKLFCAYSLAAGNGSG